MNVPEYDGIGIYRITNPINGKIYIGSTINVRSRIMSHKRSFINKTCNAKFKEDIQDYEKFKVDVIEKIAYGTNTFFLHEREEYYIKQYDCIKKGYNVDYVLYRSRESILSGYNNVNTHFYKDLFDKWEKPLQKTQRITVQQ